MLSRFATPAWAADYGFWAKLKRDAFAFVFDGGKRIGNEREQLALALILRDEAKQDALLERAAQKEIADDGRLVLAEAVNATVALFKQFGVARKFKMQQVVAALVKFNPSAAASVLTRMTGVMPDTIRVVGEVLEDITVLRRSSIRRLRPHHRARSRHQRGLGRKRFMGHMGSDCPALKGDLEVNHDVPTYRL